MLRLSLVLPDDMCTFPGTWGGDSAVRRWALPRLERLHLANASAWGATFVRCLSMASLVELHLHSAVGLLDDGGDLASRSPALRAVQLSSCNVAVTGVQALSLSGVARLVLLNCSVYPSASHAWLAGHPGVTAYGCQDDSTGEQLSS